MLLGHFLFHLFTSNLLKIIGYLLLIMVIQGVIALQAWVDFIRLLLLKTKEHRVTGLAAEQAYYYLLSLFPLLILLLSILPYLSIGPAMLLNLLNNFAPTLTTDLIKNTIVSLFSRRHSGLLTVGIIGTIWSASNGMKAFIRSMNIAFEVKETRNYLITYLVSIFLTFGLILFFVIALALPVFGNLILNAVNHFSPMPDYIQSIFHILRWLIAVAVISLVLAFLYHTAPNIHLPYRQVFAGAITATILMLIFSFGFSSYVNHFSHYSSTYGSLGGVIILMLWLHFTGMALIIGGEIIAICYRKKIPPCTKTTIETFLSKKR